MSEERGGSGRRGAGESPGVLAFISMAVAAGALIAGAAGAISAYMTEEEVTERHSVIERPRHRPRNPRGPDYAEESDLDVWIRQHEPSRQCDENVPEGLLCKICQARQVTHVLQCGHTLCKDCAVGIVKATGMCPFDREEIATVPRKVYL